MISPVRKISKTEFKEIENYVEIKENAGLKVYWPLRDNPHQETDNIGIEIVLHNLNAMQNSAIIHFWYNKKSTGSFADLQCAILLKKKIILVNREIVEKTPEKSYENVLLYLHRLTAEF
ncbi:MAG: hypothetical protein HYW34_00800 [Candidatus Brennerbacteria bacterium]|nr:hypothetical protein [Candidatus Brennerbacteria bacterium]